VCPPPPKPIIFATVESFSVCKYGLAYVKLSLRNVSRYRLFQLIEFIAANISISSVKLNVTWPFYLQDLYIFCVRNEMGNMCDHCDVLTEVLTQLTGEKVAEVIMRRVACRLHGPEAGLNHLLVATLRAD
jgi:hypothetical protein